MRSPFPAGVSLASIVYLVGLHLFFLVPHMPQHKLEHVILGVVEVGCHFVFVFVTPLIRIRHTSIVARSQQVALVYAFVRAWWSDPGVVVPKNEFHNAAATAVALSPSIDVCFFCSSSSSVAQTNADDDSKRTHRRRVCVRASAAATAVARALLSSLSRLRRALRPPLR